MTLQTYHIAKAALLLVSFAMTACNKTEPANGTPPQTDGGNVGDIATADAGGNEPVFILTLPAFRDALINAMAKQRGIPQGETEAAKWKWEVNDATGSCDLNIAGATRRALACFVQPESSKLSQVQVRIYPLRQGTANEKAAYATSVPLLVCQTLEPSTGPNEHLRTLGDLMEQAEKAKRPDGWPAETPFTREGKTTTATAEIELMLAGDYLKFSFYPKQ